jgi:hypothetical protein
MRPGGWLQTRLAFLSGRQCADASEGNAQMPNAQTAMRGRQCTQTCVSCTGSRRLRGLPHGGIRHAGCAGCSTHTQSSAVPRPHPGPRRVWPRRPRPGPRLHVRAQHRAPAPRAGVGKPSRQPVLRSWTLDGHRYIEREGGSGPGL